MLSGIIIAVVSIAVIGFLFEACIEGRGESRQHMRDLDIQIGMDAEMRATKNNRSDP